MRVAEDPTVNGITVGSRVGSRFGRYQLRKLLGKGGFGEVYEAFDTEMDRAVALKLIAAQYAQNQAFRQRLYREARTAGRLHEPHVVAVHHCGEIDGQLFIDMRLVEGTDLQTLLNRGGPLSPDRAVSIVRQIAAALDAAHANKVIHRDVKPANILLTDDDFACLVDFGLANAASDTRLTASGTTIGTFAYMAPERFSGAEVSHRADIYALACVLYECLTGSPPYPTSDLPALITAHLTAPIPRPSRMRPELHDEFDEVIARGMAKSAPDRYASAGELTQAADDALSSSDGHRHVGVLPKAQRMHQHDPASSRTGGKSLAYSQPERHRSPPKSPGSAIVRTQLPARTSLWQRIWRRSIVAPVFIALVALSVGAVFLVAARGPTRLPPSLSKPALDGPPALSTQPEQRSSLPRQVELPFTGLNQPEGVAVDAAGNVYVTDTANARVLKLPGGADISAELPFSDLNGPNAVAVDAAENVYITTDGILPPPPSVGLELPTGSNVPIKLAFTGLNSLSGVAVDSASNVYVTDSDDNRVLKLVAGSNTQIELPFVGLHSPNGLALDSAGNVYVADGFNHRVLKLPAGSNTQIELPFTGLNVPLGVVVDAAGNVYVADGLNHRVLKLVTEANMQVELPFTGLSRPYGLALDAAGDVYVTDFENNRVLKLVGA